MSQRERKGWRERSRREKRRWGERETGWGKGGRGRARKREVRSLAIRIQKQYLVPVGKLSLMLTTMSEGRSGEGIKVNMIEVDEFFRPP